MKGVKIISDRIFEFRKKPKSTFFFIQNGEFVFPENEKLELIKKNKKYKVWELKDKTTPFMVIRGIHNTDNGYNIPDTYYAGFEYMPFSFIKLEKKKWKIDEDCPYIFIPENKNYISAYKLENKKLLKVNDVEKVELLKYRQIFGINGDDIPIEMFVSDYNPDFENMTYFEKIVIEVPNDIHIPIEYLKILKDYILRAMTSIYRTYYLDESTGIDENGVIYQIEMIKNKIIEKEIRTFEKEMIFGNYKLIPVRKMVIVDNRTGNWGIIDIDGFYLSKKKWNGKIVIEDGDGFEYFETIGESKFLRNYNIKSIKIK